MEEYFVKDINLASEGEKKIQWAEAHMPVLSLIREKFKQEKPFDGLTIGACMHITKETAVLMLVLKDGGAEVYLSASNPLSTQDDVAAALVKHCIHVYGKRGESIEEYNKMIDIVISHKPNIVIDDGGDLIVALHEKYPEIAKNIIGGCEETTTGVIRERALAKEGKLLFPVIAVNDALVKRLMDNKYGSGQSTLEGIMNATHVLLSGKIIVVAGFGYVGSGIASAARGMKARVIVVEVDPIKALIAALEGYEVMTMDKAAEIGDIFITATGNINIIRKEHMLKMKDGAILANSGHFNVEINLNDLKDISTKVRRINYCVEEYTLKNGRRIYLLGEGRLVNLVCAAGHPSDVMDASFALQALSARFLLENKGKLSPDVYDVPIEINEEVAKLKLESMGIQIDTLTEKQKKYLESYKI